MQEEKTGFISSFQTDAAGTLLLMNYHRKDYREMAAHLKCNKHLLKKNWVWRRLQANQPYMLDTQKGEYKAAQKPE